MIVGDWLLEMAMTIHGTARVRNQSALASKALPFEEQVEYAMFAEDSLDCFIPAIDDLARRKIEML